jgi:alcohol dehydrogenase class IV
LTVQLAGALGGAPTRTIFREIAQHQLGVNYAAGRRQLCNMEAMMNEDVFNASIRKFLKKLGVTAQREIEKVVRQALAEGKLKGNERFPAEATVTLGGIGLSLEIKGEIDLDE